MFNIRSVLGLYNVWWCFCAQNYILRTQLLFLSISLWSNWFHYRPFHLTLKFPRTIDDVKWRLTVSYRNFKLLRGIFGTTCLANQRIHSPYLHEWIFICTGLNGSFNWYPSVLVPYLLCIITERSSFYLQPLKTRVVFVPDRVGFLLGHQILVLYILKYFYVVLSK